MGVPGPVGAGSAPGEPSGRWVAGCRALWHRLDRNHPLDSSPPVAAGTNGPYERVDDPEQWLVATESVVVDQLRVVRHRRSNALPVTGGLARFLRVEHPCRHGGCLHESGRCVEQAIASLDAMSARFATMDEYDGLQLETGHQVE